ncbi:DUF1330 domain-containing protein [Flavivirga abyssicola]|uniref:DUF1330 domain-containing protein n=1 Tax=Flavivirga abyssicola TaxID=3063533 RepID=UPI0026E0E036|nr:DUF1330 domain-containing protein [Flavivirga sp. MEBiC07777]WVK14867.1 DUF1330 domain-containing protein [Flavivirga sp. MEBiC07777]
MEKYTDVTQEAGIEFYQKFHQKGKVVMLNLLKFKKTADYSGLETIKPEKEISGEEAYKLYIKHTLPFLKKAGSSILFYGESDSFVIGPANEKWDMVILVEHESVSKFMEFAQNEAYLKYAGHRTASLEDSRLLPISQLET